MLSKSEIALLVLGVLIILTPPLLVYSTYPDTGGSEAGLEKVLSDLPVKPPPFLIGSMGYGLHRGRDYVSESNIRRVDSSIYAYWPEKNKRVFLMLLPYYVDKASNKVVSGDSLRPMIASGNVTLVVEVFETHKGTIGVIIEVRLTNQTYFTVKRS
ncbi:MAG: hypothetical protein QXM42_05640 [Zestosphaera sp.]